MLRNGNAAMLEREVEGRAEVLAPAAEAAAVVLIERPRRDRYVWGGLRIVMGWLFLWPVLDKLFGLGFATESGEGWIDGASSTYGFLTFATKGPFAEFYQGMAGSAAVEWLFLLGLLGAGLTLLLGIGGRLGAASGLMLLLMMYTASAIWPEHNPFLDDHIVYAGVLTGLALTDSGRYLGLGGRWQRTRLVQRMGILR